MMREALKGIVPTEILERRRKAYLLRGPLALLRREIESIHQLFSHSISAELGLVDPLRLAQAAECVMIGTDSRGWSSVLKAIMFEIWLRSFHIRSLGDFAFNV
jgi:asparagine synthase (glutamine-hydrolysing)